MARKRISLRQFAVSTEMYDGGVALTHSYRQCDWEEWVDGMSPPELLYLARDHAKVCDGKPQPRQSPEPGTGYLNPLIPPLWAEEISRALQTSLVYARPVVVPDQDKCAARNDEAIEPVVSHVHLHEG